VLMTLEHAGAGRRGLWSSVAQIGSPAGLLLSTAAFSLVAALPEEQFLSWGWRLPFIATVVLIGVGVFIRLGVAESPVFEQTEARTVARTADRPKAPILTLMREQPKVGFSRAEALNGLIVGSVASMIGVPLFAALSDRIGRRPVYLAGALLLGLNAFLLFPLVNTGSPGLLLLAFALGMGTHAIMFGPMGALLSELFGTRTRYTGASVGYQVASVIGGGLAPLIAGSLLAAAGGAPNAIYISVFMAATCAVTAVAAWLARETYRSDLTAETS
jgi:MHS family shikimate/dehydroshikimate transporter-like MFS transporter